MGESVRVAERIIVQQIFFLLNLTKNNNFEAKNKNRLKFTPICTVSCEQTVAKLYHTQIQSKQEI